MCLITDKLEPRTAEEDFTVYKFLWNRQSIYYPGFFYEKDKLYETEIKESDEWSCFTSADRHWLNSKYPYWSEGTSNELMCFGPGFHSMRKRINGANSTYKATIPKGATYYENPLGFIVSNKIIVHERI